MPTERSPASALLDFFAARAHLTPEAIVALEKGLEVLAIVGVSFVVAFGFKRAVLARLERLAQRTAKDVDDRVVWFVRRFYNAIVLLLVTMAALHVFGVQLTPLLAGAGIAGVAVAYAGKDLLGNMIAGGVLLVDQPIKLGDRILVEEIGAEWGGWGDIVDIGLRTTTVRTTDGLFVTYPNARLAEMVIKNFSPTRSAVRFRVRVLVSLDNDLDVCIAALEEVARGTPGVLADPAPQAVVRGLYADEGGHAHQGALLELRVWVPDVRVRAPLRSQVLLAVHRAFRQRGIAFARLEIGAHTDRAVEIEPAA